MSKMKIKIDEIRELCEKIIIKHGLTRKGAKLIVDEYLDGELRGRKCHGLAAFKKFGIKVLSSKQSNPVTEKDEDCYTLINGRGNLGQIICKDAMNNAIKKSRKKGISITGIYNMESYLMPGTYARLATEKDMIALIFNYGGWKRIAPAGSIDPIFGTNPIAVGIPSNTIPIVVDMATSKTSLGMVRLMRKLGKNVEKGVGIDKNGNPTTDPDEILKGAVLPFGGHKGYGLALVIEILTKTMFDLKLEDKSKVCRGYVFIVIDPSIFGDIHKFKENVSELIDEIKNSRKAKGVKEIFVPGEKSERIKQESLKKGWLEVEDKIINELKGML